MQKVVTFQLENFAGNFRNKNAKIFEFKIGKFCWWAKGPKSIQNFWKVNIWTLWLEKGQLLEWFENFQIKMAKIRPQTKLEIKNGNFDLKELNHSLFNKYQVPLAKSDQTMNFFPHEEIYTFKRQQIAKFDGFHPIFCNIYFDATGKRHSCKNDEAIMACSSLGHP